MAKEFLAIPEEDLLVIIDIIRSGMCDVDVPDRITEYLTEWCDSEEVYMSQVP